MSEAGTKPLRTLCDPKRSISYGIVQPGKSHDGGTPIVRVNNFRGHRLDLSERGYVSPEIEASYTRSRPRRGDILISLVGSIGQVAIAPPEIVGWNIARAVGLLPMPDAHHSLWLYYALQTPDAQSFIQRHANTTVQATFNLRDLAEIPVPYPEVGRRNSALAALSALDDKIELNRRTNETLETLAQAILKDWFVTFGPTRRKQEGATGSVAILGGLVLNPAKAATIAALFPDSFGDDGLPEGWAKGVLGDLASSVGTVVQPAAIDPNTPYIGLEHMPRKSIAISEWGTAGSVSSGKFGFETGQVLFGKLRPYFHKVSLAPVNGVASTDILVLDAKDLNDRALIATVVSTEAFVNYTDLGSDGTKMPRTSWAKMKAYPLSLCDRPVLEAFNEIVQPLHDKIISSIAENRTLAKVRDYLLPKLMSGEVLVRDAENKADAVEA